MTTSRTDSSIPRTASLIPLIRPRVSGLIPVLVAVLAVPGRAPAQQADPPPATVAPGSAILQPGDIIRLRIWREPDLSGDFPVDEHGIVVFPKLGPLAVTSRPPERLKEHLVQAYREYLRNPSIDVVMLRRINILGAVTTPNVYQVDPTTTLAEALAMAGGVTAIGNPEKIEVYRDGTKIPINFNPRTRIGDTAIRSGDHIYVPERSWITRNTGISMLVSTGVTVIMALIFR